MDMKELPEELMCGSTLWFMTSTRAATNSAGPTMEIINIKESLRRSLRLTSLRLLTKRVAHSELQHPETFMPYPRK